MAEAVEIEFRGTGSFGDDLAKHAAGIRKMGEVNNEVHADIQADFKKTSGELKAYAKTTDEATKVVVAMGKEATKTGAAQVDAVKKSREAAAQVIRDSKVMTEAQKLQAAAAGGVKKEYEALAASAKKSGAEQVKAFEQPLGLLQQIGARIDLLNQKKLSLTDEAEIAKVNDELEELGKRFDEIDVSSSKVPPTILSLQKELAAAKLEAGRLAAEFGIDSEQALKAQRRVADLSDEVGDLKSRFDAFNPDKKFEAFNQLAFSLQGGLFAIQSAAELIGGENENLNKVLGTFQTMIFATTGLQNLIGGFGDSLKTLRATLLGAAAATQVQTVAAAESTVATAASGTAATAASGGFRVLTSSVKAFTISLLTNPIFLAIAAIAALAAIIYTASQETETAAERTERWLKQYDRIRDARSRLNDLLTAMRDVNRASEDIEVGDDVNRKISLAADRARQDAQILREEAAQLGRDQQALIQQIGTFGVTAVRAVDKATGEATVVVKNLSTLSDENKEVVNGLISRYEDLETAAGEASLQAVIRERQGQNELMRLQLEAKQAAKAENDERKGLREDLIRSEREFAERLEQQRRRLAGENDPFERIRLERKSADEEIAEMERGFKRKIAAIELQKQLGVKAWRELSDLEKEAREDQFIRENNVQLPLQQQEAFNAARLLIEGEYLDKYTELLDEQAKKRVDIMAEGAEKEKALFATALAEQIAELRKYGVTEAEIIEFIRRRRKEFTQGQDFSALELDEQIAVARLQAQRNNGERQLEFERRIELEVLATRTSFAQKKLDLIVDDGTKETQLRRAQFEQLLAELEKQRAELLNTPIRFNLLDLLGIKPEDQAAVQQGLQSISASFRSILSSWFEDQQAMVDAQIDATDQLIEDSQRRKDELQAQLDEALQLQRDGYANNADAIREEIGIVALAEEEATRRKKQLIEENKRLAAQQARIDTAMQISSLITANAHLFAKGALAGIPGIIGAIAFGAAMLAAFIGAKAKIRAASQPDQFEEGGWIKGKSHKQGGVMIEAEGDEFMVRKRSAKRMPKLLEAINNQDFRRLQMPDIKPLLDGLNIRLEDEAVNRVIESRQRELAAGSVTMIGMRTDRMEERLDTIVDELQIHRKERAVKEKHTRMPDGSLIIERPGLKRTIRKK